MATSTGRPLETFEDGRPRFNGCSRIQQYDYIGKLGEGTFGEVSKAKSKKTGQIVALKKILMHNEKDGFPITALREIKLLKQLKHINILTLVEMAVERPKNPAKKTSMFMVTPYMDHDLSGLLENPNVHFTEPQIKCYMKQLLEGCAYLHENRILHRDMKAANLLINNKGILQIADFGLARPYDDEPPKAGQGGGEATREYTCLVVTRWYRPPELLLQLRKYTTAIDMWGVGCVFGEMFKGKPILAGSSDLNQAHLIFGLVGGPTDESMPGWRELPGVDGNLDFKPRQATLRHEFRECRPQAISLLEELLRLDWRKRINAIDALEHPYFHTDPLPAKPGDLPTFEDSHELDRRKFRDQKNKPPPAPAGGSVGVGPHGEWGINGRPLPPDQREVRIVEIVAHTPQPTTAMVREILETGRLVILPDRISKTIAGDHHRRQQTASRHARPQVAVEPYREPYRQGPPPYRDDDRAAHVLEDLRRTAVVLQQSILSSQITLMPIPNDGHMTETQTHTHLRGEGLETTTTQSGTMMAHLGTTDLLRGIHHATTTTHRCATTTESHLLEEEGQAISDTMTEVPQYTATTCRHRGDEMVLHQTGCPTMHGTETATQPQSAAAYAAGLGSGPA
ncbi:Serine/threonine-protein kinase bur1 [Cyphellophora attinorum]|uniref:Serine/threonine-protein kinase BUR1 n=1 Tax=Cyphellophora attinorum TaxID=1664694 RepID=A0A0N1HBK0_9EURO|nr:Serine/threonine-protein kinase bur1 [Phialophora attinorum]KPI41692.1 Serine/threonine-protein kinase bur1 [Phialophora attinorum]